MLWACRDRNPARRQMLDEVIRAFEGDGAVVAGVLSGTSADGITVVLARMRARGRELARPELVACETLAFPGDLATRVRAVLDGEPTGLRATALLSRDLGRAFGAAARAVARARGVPIDLVASHGQTVWHHDGRESSGAATLQLGDGDFASEACGCAVVSDFRQRDVAAGGEGAPLSALADGSIFAHLHRPCAILNLGGIGNLTVLFESEDAVLAFDTGPANCLLDGIARRMFDRPFDADGAIAARGRADARLVRELGAHPFLSRKPPRSTGRDTFGAAWVAGVIERARSLGVASAAKGAHDLMASAVEFVAACVARSLDEHVHARIDRVIVAGGGAQNRALISALERATHRSIVPSDEVGVPAQAREGLVFAVLGARCVLGIASTHPGATGARRGRVLGKLSWNAIAERASPALRS
jgi:anhydro-N-acetylmuramic acid kinase